MYAIIRGVVQTQNVAITTMSLSNSSRVLLIVGAVIVLVLLAGIGLRFATRPEVPEVTNADPSNTQLVSAGERLYTTRCSGCHGALSDEISNQAAPGLNGASQAAQRTNEELYEIIANGKGTMPAFGNRLSESEIWAIVSFMRSAWQGD